MRLALIGFGAVGQGLAEILHERGDALRAAYGFAPAITGVATRSRGSLYRAEGLDIGRLLAAMRAGGLDRYPDEAGLERGVAPLALARTPGADVLVESTYTDFRTAQPALDFCRAALETGKHVVLANKGPVALAYAELRDRARDAGRLLRFEATVMAGTPTLRLGMQALAGCRVSAAQGILNGTTNYMLGRMEDGLSYADALAEAQAKGYAEADPTADVDGWDAAGKAVILAQALFERPLSLADMTVDGISRLTAADVEAARAAGERWKLVARVTPEGGEVRPLRLPLAHPLAAIGGTTNAVTFATDLLGDVTLVGRGAGGQATGFGLLSDLLDIHRFHEPALFR